MPCARGRGGMRSQHKALARCEGLCIRGRGLAVVSCCLTRDLILKSKPVHVLNTWVLSAFTCDCLLVCISAMTALCASLCEGIWHCDALWMQYMKSASF